MCKTTALAHMLERLGQFLHPRFNVGGWVGGWGLVSFTMSLMCNFKRHGTINHLRLLFKKTPALQLSGL